MTTPATPAMLAYHTADSVREMGAVLERIAATPPADRAAVASVIRGLPL